MSYSQNDKGQYVVPLVDFGIEFKDNFGLTIREHEAFGVDNVHSPNSHHYHGNAIDIQDWRDDVIDGVDWRTRTKATLTTATQGAGVDVFGPNSVWLDTTSHLHLKADLAAMCTSILINTNISLEEIRVLPDQLFKLHHWPRPKTDYDPSNISGSY